MQKQTVFISHSSKDNDFVTKLKHDFEAKNIQTWVDKDMILPGDDFISKIEEGLKIASHVIIVFSPDSIISQWVKEETHATQIRAIKNNVRLIPILIGDFDPSDLPLLLQSKVYVSFNSDLEYQESFEKLFTAFSSVQDLMDFNNFVKGKIEELNILSTRDSENYAFEVLLYNPSNFPIFIKKVTLIAYEDKSIMYFEPPPTRTYTLNLDSLNVIQEGIAKVEGNVLNELDNLGHLASGTFINGPYSLYLEVSFSLYANLPRLGRGILRFVFNEKPKKEAVPTKDKSSSWENSERILTRFQDAPIINVNPEIDYQNPNHERGFSILIFDTDKSRIVGKIQSAIFIDLASRSRSLRFK